MPFVGKDAKVLGNNRCRRKAGTYRNVLLRRNSQIGLFSYLGVGYYFQIIYWTQSTWGEGQNGSCAKYAVTGEACERHQENVRTQGKEKGKYNR